MTKKINISIPQPCHQNWEEMTDVDKGKFCASCQKNVIDFTTASDKEIINALEKDNKLCGRFLNSQLNRDLIQPKEKSTFWLATTTTIISLIGLNSNEAIAQDEPKTEQTDKKVLIDNNINKKVHLRGIVVDSNNIPLPDIFVSFKGNQKTIKTDNNGMFDIETNNCSKIIFHQENNDFQYYHDNFIADGENLNVKIICEKYEVKATHIKTLAGGCRVLKKRSFFGRLFHKNKYK